MKLVRMVLMLFLLAGWAAAQCGGHAMGDEKGKKDSASAEHKAMCCCCCKNMSKHDAKAGDKDAAKPEAKSEGGTMAGGMGCCATMSKGKDAAGGGMSCCANMAGGAMKCGGSATKSEGMPEQKMK